MPDSNVNVLSATLEVKDSFSSQLNKFAQALNSTESTFTKFVNRINQANTQIANSFDKVGQKLNQTTTKMEQGQQKSLDDIVKKYTKFGEEVENIFKNIQKEADQIGKSMNIPTVNNSGSSSSHNHGSSGMSGMNTEFALNSMLSGDFSMMMMNLGVIGGTLLGASKILSSIDNWMQQGYNTLNSLSTGLLSFDGLKAGLESAGEFQSNRIAMDVLYGNDPVKGQYYYQMGTKLAKDTPYSEESVGELQKKLSGAKLEYSSKDLMTLLDVASIKPELGASHVGFSLVDAIGGRSSSLKMNYMLDNKAINEYLKKLKTSSNATDRVNAQKWADAFTKTGTVGNRQEYFDLLINYVQNQTKYNGLTEKYAHTINGLFDRLSGNWDTLRADLLGIDANGTGLAKTGQITVFSSISDFIDNLEKWLNEDKTKSMLQGLGNGLGKGINAIAGAVEKLMNDGAFEKVGKVFEDVGNSVANFIEKLDKDGTLDKIIEKLPDLLNVILNNEAIKLESQFKTDSSFVNGDVSGGVKNWLTGKELQGANALGDKDANWNKADDLSKNKSWLEQWWNGLWNQSNDSNTYLSDINASAYLAQNPNLSNDERNTIQGMLNSDNAPIYNITIGEIKADNFDEIVASLQQYQNNQK